ncbi:MAG: energy-coupling factor transporter ATPase [Thermodesulfobacteriota bacterium]|nr:energy-coupling factor transporter ATPase [Thermodesulfobacteriota bacterium]
MVAIVSLCDVYFSYKDIELKALDGINLEIDSGEVVIIMGPSGSGKSTLCSTLNGLIPHLIKGDLQGDITIDGIKTAKQKVKEFAPIIGLVFQDFEGQLFCSNVELEAAFGPENLGLPREEIKRRVDESLRFVRLDGFERRQPSTLSGGQKQRLAIASVLSLNPKILCLDEPTTDLDPIGKREIFAITKELHNLEVQTIIIVEHETEEILNSDRIVLMDKGRIKDIGPAHDILKRVSLLKSLGIMPLQVTELFYDLGFPKLPLTLKEALEIMRENDWSLSLAAYKSLLIEDEKRIERLGEITIDIQNLTYSYDGEKPALKEVTLSIREGEFVAIVGQNGSGKTTLVKHLNGLIMPTSGDVYINQKNTKEEDIYSLSIDVGYVFQNPDHQIFAQSVADEVGFGLKIKGISEHKAKRMVEEALYAVGLIDFEDEDPFVLTKGQRQRIAVASVMASKPRVIILDEPTTGLDHKELRGMMKLIKELNQRGHTIIIVTHTMWVVAEYAKRVVVMGGGRVIMDGPTREVFSKEEELRALFLKTPAIVSLGNRLGYTTLSIEEFKGCIEKKRDQ